MVAARCGRGLWTSQLGTVSCEGCYYASSGIVQVLFRTLTQYLYSSLYCSSLLHCCRAMA